MTAGMLTLEELKREIAADTIDTVIVAMVDLQGRLVGKRFHAEYFADSGHQETHGCNYLLGVDIEMEPRALAEALTMRGMEVSGIEVAGADWSGVVVGRLLDVQRHPNADTLWVTRVDVGPAGGALEIVCGAQNL